MAKKMLGKVVAGAALGGASLLVFAPGIAFADGHHDGKDKDGKVLAKPHVVKAGEEVKLLEICSEKQEHAFVWSKVTGKVELKPVKDDHGDKRDDWRGGEEDSYGRDGKDEHGKDDNGKDHNGKDENGKDHNGKDENGKDHNGKDENGKDENGKDENGKDHENGNDEANGGYGAGAAAADGKDEDRKDWNGYEHGQDRGDDKGDKKDDGKKDEDKSDHEENGSWDSKDRENGREDDKSDHGKDEDRWEHKRDFLYYGEAKVDKHAKPGKYELKGSCGEGTLVVVPRGGVDGGDGGATGTDRGLAAGGASLLGAAALGGIVLMRRRRTDESLV
ncbi:hypothetical protein [Micromonospora sp. WMMD812]|uniref:hypothetical protein n=1 Tax=Micromonospora sp. WMMD812 TaxID=3015152 RepID=UPI00248C3024|nr:hypothetical protein [Micromonospora sp. WMMD812]WBB66753.1 hypothetical protein O7603_27010 [Micromonospora sp. WMMD812]